MFYNQFTLIGRVGNFIDNKEFVKDGKTYTLTKFSLVVDQPKSDTPNVFIIESWQPCCNWLRTGRLLLVTGQLISWETETNRGINLKAQTVRFLDRKPQVESPDNEVEPVSHLDEIAA